MISFSQDSTFNLTKIEDNKINKNAAMLLVEDEKLIGVYRTVRDQVVFTDSGYVIDRSYELKSGATKSVQLNSSEEFDHVKVVLCGTSDGSSSKESTLLPENLFTVRELKYNNLF